MSASLKPVTKDNWIKCIDLSLYPHQIGNLALNVETIAESKFEPDNILRAIYLNDTVIGMLAYSMEDEPPSEVYWLFRFMIDKDYQNKGYGTEALKLLFEEISRLGGKKIYTSHKPENKVAGKLYQKVGFSYNGELHYGEPLMEKGF